MYHFTRREFLHTSALLTGAALISSSFAGKKVIPKLSFSTLGCPDWSFTKIVEFAVAHGYKGIEIRGIQRELDLVKCKEFNTAQSRLATLALMKEKGLRFVGLGASANLHTMDAAERKKNLDEARRFVDLAAQINCPYIRVFPNNFPKGQDRQATIELIVKGLQELGDHARGSKVTVLMETHGDLVRSKDISEIMQAADHKHTGLVWDVSNMWTVTKEPPGEVYEKLKKYIHHTHIKDAKLVEDKPQYTLLGKGEVPIMEAIDLLYKGGYKGYYSFEWEKLWHPEIAEPEIALADYPLVMKEHFSKSI